MTQNSLSQTQKLLLAAASLDTPFSVESLIVAAWKANPEVFGLNGYTAFHPDSNKVSSNVMGKKGLVSKGLFLKTGPKRYLVTPLGMAEVNRLTRTELLGKRRLPAHLDRFVTVLLSSEVYRKVEAGKKQDVSFRDACDWWRLGNTGRLTREAVTQFLAEITTAFREVETILDGGPVLLRCDREFSAGDLRELRNIDGWLREAKKVPLKLLGGKE